MSDFLPFTIDNLYVMEYSKDNRKLCFEITKENTSMAYKYKTDFPNGLKEALLPRDEFNPLPKYEDESVWAEVPTKERKTIIKTAEDVLQTPVPRALATSYMQYYRTGVRDYEMTFFRPMKHALFFLTAAECLERQGRFTDALLDHIWALCETTTWVLPPHNWSGMEGYLNGSDRPLADINDPQIDIMCGTLAEYLAWTLYIMRGELDKISYLISERVEYELNKRIIEPFCNRREEWWISMSTHNWHMWTTSNCLAVVLLTETNPAKRAKAVELALKYTEDYIQQYTADGSNTEGATYWVASAGSMYYALKLLQLASGGLIDYFKEPMVRNIASYIRNIHIREREFYNYCYTARYNTLIQGLDLYEIGKDIEDQGLMELGTHLYHYDGLNLFTGDHIYPMFRQILFSHIMKKLTPKAPNVGYYWSERQQMMIAREKPGKPDGFMLGARGHNGHSDSHRDAGSFVLYYDGKPIYIDLGAAKYSRAVIDQRYRHQHFACVPENHNTITVNGMGQLPGAMRSAMSEALYQRAKQTNACTIGSSYDDGENATLELEMGHLLPTESGVSKCTRTFTMDRALAEVRIRQQVKCEKESEICLNFITCEKPDITDGIVVNGTKLIYDINQFQVRTEEIDTEGDVGIYNSWGEHVYRTTLTTHEKELDSTFIITTI